ncbi:MAG: amidohydrolase family protein [Acidobacteria bacterium]|nr:amidohydrolase family protein [Acidobacteriota bacterium]
MLRTLALLLSCALAPLPAAVLHCGKLIDVEKLTVLEEVSIVTSGDEILRVEPGFAAPAAGEEAIDLRSHTCMPGWMDMHVHLASESNPKAYEERFRLNAADYAFRAAVHAKRTLLAGFTTVRDLGTRDGVSIALARAIEQGLTEGPTIYNAGRALATTGGHADPTNGVRDDLMHDPGPAEGVVNGVDDARKAVRQRYKEGSDLIKITATGGVLSVAKNGQNPQFTEEEIRAIVETAKDYDFHVAAHAHGAEGIRRALRAGVHSIEHGTLMDDEGIRLFQETAAWWVPTISAGKFVAEKAEVQGYYPAVIIPKALAIGPQVQETFRKAYKAGVKIAFGTDCGVSPHGSNAKEFVYMTEAGMPPLEAIRAATLSPAQLLGIADRVGTVAPGKAADIVATPRDPAEDITATLQPSFVMKRGRVYRRP